MIIRDARAAPISRPSALRRRPRPPLRLHAAPAPMKLLRQRQKLLAQLPKLLQQLQHLQQLQERLELLQLLKLLQQLPVSGAVT